MTDVNIVSMFKLGTKCSTCGKKREGEPSDCWCSAPLVPPAVPERKCSVCETTYYICSDPRDRDAHKINGLNMCKDCFLNWAVDHHCTNCDEKLAYPGDGGWCRSCWDQWYDWHSSQ